MIIMCGITGWIHYKRNLTNQENIVGKMAEKLSKRGPDETNTWVSPHAVFGHKRLIVVDPEGGRQPMSITHQGHMYTICYNGELYNTEDLRAVLRGKGYTFNGHSDTEVLLISYIEWREECVNHLNGIFAFSVWDSQKEHVFIGRDRMGVKPLFYSEKDGGFLFGSEIKALLAHPDVKPEVAHGGLSEVLGLGPSRTPGEGVFKGVKELRPAHAMTFSKDGLKIWRYWNVKSEKHADSFADTVSNVRFLLSDAIKRQLVSDVPLCSFLSGGVDSSAITAIAANTYRDEGKGRLHTYSIDYEENDQYFTKSDFQPNSDAPWIDKMSSEFNTIHHRCVISQQELKDYLIEAVHVRDLPGMADVDSSLLWFCKEIKEEFTVGLSGECADEIFGGYPWFHREDDFNRRGFPWMRSVDERQGLLKDDWKKKLNLQEYVLAQYDKTVAETPLLDGENEIETKRRQLFYLNLIWFMTTLLDRKDRMSMGASLEVRVPFADHRLVEYVWNIPWEMKMHENREKGILRKALEGILPNEVLYRKKSPYPKTHHPVYTKLVSDWLEEILADRSSVLYELFNEQKLKEIVKTGGSAFKVPWYGQLMTGPQLLAHLAQIHVWFKEYNIQIVE
ncbi:asparagine synthase (glutamine-hydrolyzing) [Rossellomorea oryzaecorticis]|uniref:asparagine synthase (glutamine-hydrolyzing) n=1 Tax=Rossellomorea oryzaecorticis TaxID=1396505 RepID=A0ABW8VN30_9BACI|nr:asparagine synthase (glutamine-hydrolyzing) [[Bacillus] enclensis]MBH9966419.1 asparagine synthase (glutamine-hydrolyzing) [[Bacillus] enclensis]